MRRAGRSELTTAEFNMLQMFVERPSRVSVARQHHGSAQGARVVAVRPLDRFARARLRKKIETDADTSAPHQDRARRRLCLRRRGDARLTAEARQVAVSRSSASRTARARSACRVGLSQQASCRHRSRRPRCASSGAKPDVSRTRTPGGAASTHAARSKPDMPPGMTTSEKTRSMPASLLRASRSPPGRLAATSTCSPAHRAAARSAAAPARCPRRPEWFHRSLVDATDPAALGVSGGVTGIARQIEADSRAFADLAVDRGVAAGLLDEPVDAC